MRLKTSFVSRPEISRPRLRLNRKTKTFGFEIIIQSKIKTSSDEGVEILNSQLDRRSMVIWFWCRSQAALEHIRKQYESNQLLDFLHAVADLTPSPSESVESKFVNIDSNQFKKTIVVCSTSANFAKRIDAGNFDTGKSKLQGVAKLRDEIFTLLRSVPPAPNAILVFEDRNPFLLKLKIEIPEIRVVDDCASCVKKDCLYVLDVYEKCVWKITRERDDQHKIIKWLTPVYPPATLSASNDGQLLMINISERSPSFILMIYGSDAELIRYFQLPTVLEDPTNAVKTSIGNFIVYYQFNENWRDSHSRKYRMMQFGLCEVSSDGQMVISRFTPLNERQKLSENSRILLDSDDRLFVADFWNDRVVLLDSHLKWNRILVPSEEGGEEEEQTIQRPEKLCYDEETKQLIVGRYSGQLNVYTLHRD